MLHRDATIAASLTRTARVPVVHDIPEAQQWQAAQKQYQEAWKANKAAGITRVHYGVYDTTKKRKYKKYNEVSKNNLADRDGYLLSGELSAHQKRALLVIQQVPRIPDTAGDAPEGPVQRNAFSTYEDFLQSERVHSAYCSAARAHRLAERYKDYANFKKTKKQIYKWFRSKNAAEKRKNERDAADGALRSD
jgi:hypothetical protein